MPVRHHPGFRQRAERRIVMQNRRGALAQYRSVASVRELAIFLCRPTCDLCAAPWRAVFGFPVSYQYQVLPMGLRTRRSVIKPVPDVAR